MGVLMPGIIGLNEIRDFVVNVGRRPTFVKDVVIDDVAVVIVWPVACQWDVPS